MASKVSSTQLDKSQKCKMLKETNCTILVQSIEIMRIIEPKKGLHPMIEYSIEYEL